MGGRKRLRPRQCALAWPLRRARPRRFPGAFPPARIVEMDEASHCGGRTGRGARNSSPSRSAAPARRRRSGDRAPFIDGAVLNNRPFQLAISAIHGRPAYRQVDRRLVYIEPHPAPPVMPSRQRSPGFFATLRGAMSDIPTSQPVTNELNWVVEFNDRVRRLRAINDSARPQVSRLVWRAPERSTAQPPRTSCVTGASR